VAASALRLQLVFVSPESSVSLVLAKSFIVLMERMSPSGEEDQKYGTSETLLGTGSSEVMRTMPQT
jgi:hypothetical protein